MVDVSKIEGVEPGDVVTLFGSDGENQLSVEEVARKMGTINYEVICMVGRRVPRVYIQNGKIINIVDYLK